MYFLTVFASCTVIPMRTDTSTKANADATVFTRKFTRSWKVKKIERRILYKNYLAHKVNFSTFCLIYIYRRLRRGIHLWCSAYRECSQDFACKMNFCSESILHYFFFHFCFSIIIKSLQKVWNILENQTILELFRVRMYHIVYHYRPWTFLIRNATTSFVTKSRFKGPVD